MRALRVLQCADADGVLPGEQLPSVRWASLHKASMKKQQLENEREQLQARVAGALQQMEREKDEKYRLEDQLRCVSSALCTFTFTFTLY